MGGGARASVSFGHISSLQCPLGTFLVCILHHIFEQSSTCINA